MWTLRMYELVVAERIATYQREAAREARDRLFAVAPRGRRPSLERTPAGAELSGSVKAGTPARARRALIGALLGLVVLRRKR